MREWATRSVEEERSRNGLVIERAIYGLLLVERIPVADLAAASAGSADGDASLSVRGARGVLSRLRSRFAQLWAAFSQWMLSDEDEEERSGDGSRRVQRAMEATSAHWRLHPSTRSLLSGAPLAITSLIATSGLPPAQTASRTPHSASTSTPEASESDYSGVLDVTTALRSLVRDSRLVLAEGVRKCELLGFLDPAPPFGMSAPGRKRRWLAIRYRWLTSEYEMLVGDREGLALPQNPNGD